MRWQFRRLSKSRLPFALYLKCGAIFFLFLLSILIVACGSGTDTNLGQPPVTVTINLGQLNGSPTPPLPEYTCSAWVTNTTPGINTNSVIGVYAKFVHNVNGNPEGVYPASATATVLWPEGNVNVSSNTTPDGLAVFTVSTANRAADLNKIILVTVSFTGPAGVPPCTVGVDQAAFFTLVIATATAGASPSPGGSGTPPGGSGTPTATTTPSPSATACVTPGGDPLKRTPTPSPTPCH
ncbi:MAG TPA: hypothetical protein VEV19_07520 [Ktedonobacteraceae bacterium]|nr:hypothetical protein [Ktedonobacteraceae bacterium]